MPLRSQEHATHGAVMLDSQTTRFALWAPDAQQVEVEPEGAAAIPLQRRDGGWFEACLPCPAGTRYRYRIDGDSGDRETGWTRIRQRSWNKRGTLVMLWGHHCRFCLVQH